MSYLNNRALNWIASDESGYLWFAHKLFVESYLSHIELLEKINNKQILRLKVRIHDDQSEYERVVMVAVNYIDEKFEDGCINVNVTLIGDCCPSGLLILSPKYEESELVFGQWITNDWYKGGC